VARLVDGCNATRAEATPVENAKRMRGPMRGTSSLIARASEMAILEEELRRSAAGEFRSVLLVGDAGVGKTRLATEFLRRHRDATIGLCARAYPLGETAPFGLWSQALERRLRTMTREAVAELCGGCLEDLAVLLRSAASALGHTPAAEPPRARLLEGLAVLTGNLARQAPVVVVLDDIHHADSSSWEALYYLAQNVPDARMLVILAARPLQHTGTEILLHLEQDEITRRLRLAEFDRAAIEELSAGVLGRRPPEQLVSWLADRSRGNPFFAIGLLEALTEEGADLRAPKLRFLPEALTERVKSRLRLLDEPALATLELLAVLGRATETVDLVSLSDRPAQRLGEILEGLVRDRLVTEVECGDEATFEISHPLVQETIYRGIGSVRRKALHRVIGRVLLDGGRLDEAASHFARSALRGDNEAIEVLREALRQAEERRAFKEGVTIFSLLVELLPPADTGWVEVLEAMAWDAEWSFRGNAHAAEGIKAMRRIDGLLEDSVDPSRRAMVKFRLATFQTWGTGELELAERDCAQALALFEKAGNVSRSLLAANELATIRGLRGDLPRMEAEVTQAVEIAASRGDRFVEMQGTGTLGWNYFHRGIFGQAEAAMRRSAEIARELGYPYRWATALGVEALCAAWDGRVEESLATLRQAGAADSRLADLLPEVDACIHWIAGNFRTAVQSANRALALRPELSRRRGFCLWCAALAAVDLDKLPDARRFMNRALAIYGDREFLLYPVYRDYGEAMIRIREGDRASSLATLRRVADEVLEIGAFPFAAFVLADFVELTVLIGRGQDTSDATRQLHEIARRLGSPLYAGLAAMASAWTARSQGTATQAVRNAEQATELLAKTGCRAWRGRATEVLARCLSATDLEAAVGPFQHAAALYDACGAAWRRDRALRALKRLGPAGRKTADATLNTSSLTRREREVAKLAGLGNTAREIGAQLFVSDRTVEKHLANVYAKLGLQSKVALARRLSEFDLD
jgi:DNA-binding CsgD family transcriptional regulator